MLHVLRSPLIVSENFAFLCHVSYWRHTSKSKDTNLLPLPCKRLDAWLGWLRKLMVVPSPEADVLSSISTFVLNVLGLKWCTYKIHTFSPHYFHYTKICSPYTLIRFFFLFFYLKKLRVKKKNKNVHNNNKEMHFFCSVAFSQSNNLDTPDYPFLAISVKIFVLAGTKIPRKQAP